MSKLTTKKVLKWIYKGYEPKHMFLLDIVFIMVSFIFIKLGIIALHEKLVQGYFECYVIGVIIISLLYFIMKLTWKYCNSIGEMLSILLIFIGGVIFVITGSNTLFRLGALITILIWIVSIIRFDK